MDNPVDVKDVTKFDPVIREVLFKLRVKSGQMEDMKQECYLILLQRQSALEKAGDKDRILAAEICKNRIIDIYRADTQQQPSHKTKHGVRIDSLSEPHVATRAAKIPIKDFDHGLADEQLHAAILSLDMDEYRVVYSIYIEGKEQEETGRELGLSRQNVRTLMERGVRNLKKYFEVGE